MSLVLMVYLFIIQCALWSYDRFMMEQDMAIMLLRCAGAEEIEVAWQQEKRDWGEKTYLWVGEREAALEKGLFTLKITGEAQGGSMGDIGVSYEMWDLKPQQWLRGKEKIEEIKEEGEKEK